MKLAHPLFSSVDESIDIESFATSLGFGNCLVYGMDSVEGAVEGYESDPQKWFADWQPTAPAQNMQLALAWEGEDGPVALFVTPETDMAKALWMVGLGQQVSEEPRKKSWCYSPSEDFERGMGGFDSRTDAIFVGADNASFDGLNRFHTASYLHIRVSDYACADNLCDELVERMDADMGESAADAGDDLAGFCDQLQAPLDLLVDGWARLNGIEPACGTVQEIEAHNVEDALTGDAA